MENNLKISYRVALEKDIRLLNAVANTCFPDVVFSESDIFFTNPESVAICAEYENKMVGCAGCSLIDDRWWYFKKYFYGKTGFLHTNSVLPSFRNLGIATKFTQIRVDLLKSLGYNSVLVAADRKSGEIYPVMDGILTKQGFTAIEEIERIWCDNLCNLCNDKCHCKSVVYTLKLGD